MVFSSRVSCVARARKVILQVGTFLGPESRFKKHRIYSKRVSEMLAAPVVVQVLEGARARGLTVATITVLSPGNVGVVDDVLDLADRYGAWAYFQPAYNDKRFSGINPYALDFGMMRDIERVCMAPTDEDRQYLGDIAGTGDPMGALRHIWANYRDESFILQYLSPHMIRDFGLFRVHDDSDKPHLSVEAIHDERGYRDIRRALGTLGFCKSTSARRVASQPRLRSNTTSSRGGALRFEAPIALSARGDHRGFQFACATTVYRVRGKPARADQSAGDHQRYE
mgnify:CR=1 FL=1